MAKETFYFSHDYTSRLDIKVKNLLKKHGMLGYGIWWAIVEDLYNNANSLPTDYEAISYDLRASLDIVTSVINDFDLFVVEDKTFSSLSVQRRLDGRAEKSEKAKESAKKRWGLIASDANALRTHSASDANALRPEYDRNALKESKVKESKVKENIEAKASPASPSVDKELKESYTSLAKDLSSVSNFIKSHKPTFHEPYYDLWNIFATKYGPPRLKVWNDTRKKKLSVRLKNPNFNFVEILAKAAKSEKALTLGFLTFDWLIENENNFTKVIEGNYENNEAKQPAAVPAVNTQSEETKKLIAEKLKG